MGHTSIQAWIGNSEQFYHLLLALKCEDTVSDSTVGKPSLVGNSSGDVVYSLTFDRYNNSFKLSACSPQMDFNSSLGVYFDLNLTSEAFSINDSCGPQSEIERFLPSGTFYVVVGSVDSGEGNFSLNLTCGTWRCISHFVIVVGCRDPRSHPKIRCASTQGVEIWASSLGEENKGTEKYHLQIQ